MQILIDSISVIVRERDLSKVLKAENFYKV